MKKIISNFVIIWVVINLIYLTYLVYRDISINKLFNYSSRLKNVTYYETSVQETPNQSYSYTFKFKANDNYLGALILPVGTIGSGDGQIKVIVKDINDNKIVSENYYDYNFVRHLDDFIVGFPPLPDSKDRYYLLTVNLKGENYNPNFLNSNSANNVSAKYVFPRSVLLDNPYKFANIIAYRAEAAVRSLNPRSTIVIILLLSLFILYLTNTHAVSGFFNNTKGNSDLIAWIFRKKFSSLGMSVAFLMTLSIPLLLIAGKFRLAEFAANYIWILSLISFVWYLLCVIAGNLPRIFKILALKFEATFSGYFNPKNFRRNVIIIFLLLIILSGLSRYYQIGGDDSKLYFLYPDEFLKNFGVKIISDTSMSSIVTFGLPSVTAFALMMVVLNKVIGFLNLQAVLYTTNLIGGFTFFYLMLCKLNKPRGTSEKIVNAVSSVLYIFSIFNAYTLYNSKLLAIFLVSLFPLSIFLFLQALEKKRYELILMIAVICSLFSFFVYSAPWFLAAVLAVIPLIVYIFLKYKILVLKYVILFGIVTFLLNFHWIIYLPSTTFLNKSSGVFNHSLVSEDFRKENERGIRVTSEINSAYFPLMGLYHEEIQKNFSWTYYSIFSQWYRKISFLNIFYFMVIAFAGVFIKRDQRQKTFYVVSLLCFLLSTYFFTVNITGWGLNIFVWLNNNIPGFVLFRNMYDKFGFSMAFTFSLLLSVSLNNLLGNIANRQIRKNLLLLFVVVTLFNIKPYLFGEYDRLPLWTTNNTYISMSRFNDDFVSLIKYISSSEDPGKYLILPLSSGNTFSVSDKYLPNHYYSGTSPLLVLTGKNDFSGILSFGAFGSEIFKDIKSKDYTDIGYILQKLNVRYVILNKDITNDLKNSFVYSEKIYYLQDDEMVKSLIGDKITDFGDKYSLYKINSSYDSSKIYLAKSPETLDGIKNINFKKIDSHLYEISLPQDFNEQFLIFLDPYQEGWKIYFKDSKIPIKADKFLALGYANGWKLDTSSVELKGKNLILYYKPYDYYWPALFISFGTYLLSLVLFIKYEFSKKN